MSPRWLPRAILLACGVGVPDLSNTRGWLCCYFMRDKRDAPWEEEWLARLSRLYPIHELCLEASTKERKRTLLLAEP